MMTATQETNEQAAGRLVDMLYNTQSQGISCFAPHAERPTWRFIESASVQSDEAIGVSRQVSKSGWQRRALYFDRTRMSLGAEERDEIYTWMLQEIDDYCAMISRYSDSK